ncbi:MAG TPA: glycosyltransferase [Ferruginibacter sp.]|nr:glycosyltransferase [Ferruginibacter sp.]HRO96763.1 glycosyltransferase [Ferruginibacter sp.]
MYFEQLLHHWKFMLFALFVLVAAIQLFYYLYFFIRLAIYKVRPKSENQTHPVSVIICARDEADNLARNLPGSLVQAYKSTHEIIVVNDNSYDETKYLLEELRKTFKQLHVVDLTQEAKMIPGKKFPLSIGIKTAKYEVVLLTDADCIPASEHWIERMQEAYGPDTEIVLGYGAYAKKKGMLNKLIRWETFHAALQYLSYARAGIPYMGVGRNLSYKKTVFFRQKGFSSHNHIPGGDDDLFINKVANKKNTAIQIHPDSFTISKPASTWSQWRQQKMRHYTTGKFYKGFHRFLLGTYALSHFLFYPLGVCAAIWYDWRIALGIIGLRWIIQSFVFAKTMKKLDEKDLIPYFPLLDIWMFFYYIIFAGALIRKPNKNWK